MQTQIRDLAARFARGLPEFSLTLSSEGAGNAGRRCAAAKSVHVVTTVTPESPGIPRAMVYGLLRALPGDRALLPPSPAGPTASLTPASRCQDHTTWPSAATTPVSRTAASTASHPDVRDVRETPLWVEQDIDGYRLICDFGKSEYFRQRGWTGFWVICPSGGFVELAREIVHRARPVRRKNLAPDADGSQGSSPSGTSFRNYSEPPYGFHHIPLSNTQRGQTWYLR